MLIFSLFIFREHSTRGTCVRQGDLFYSAGLHRNQELATGNTEEIGRGFAKATLKKSGEVLQKMQVNEPEG